MKEKKIISPHIKKILKSLPNCPGVYLMKDKDGKVLYVGKAKVLKNRVKHYFQNTPNHSIGTRVMMKYIIDVEIIKVEKEVEAIMLESNMIKEYMPRYNVRMRDDKNFTYIKITLGDDFPEIVLVRKMIKDNAKYFGPYTSTDSIKKTLKIAREIFPYRACRGEILIPNDLKNTYNKPEKNIKIKGLSRKAPCLDYHIKRCSAPCIGKVSHLEYKDMIIQIISLLKGNHIDIIKYLNDKMKSYVEVKNFELAAKMRDRLKVILNIIEKQKIIVPKDNNQDILTPIKCDSKTAFVNLLEIRGGKLIDIKNIEMDISKDISEEKILENFISQYYKVASSIPSEIVSEYNLTCFETLYKWFKEELDSTVLFTVPKMGIKKNLLKLGLDNAIHYKNKIKVSWDTEEKDIENSLKIIKEKFKLNKTPNRIECFDISHMGGTETTASMVVFEDSGMKKSDYRRFKINSVTEPGEPDDCKSMAEAIQRRIKYLGKNTLEDFDAKVRKVKKNEQDIVISLLKKEKLDYHIENFKELYVLDIGKKIIGTCLIRSFKDKDYLELSSFSIIKKYRGKGIAKLFIQKVLSRFKKVKIYCISLDEKKQFFMGSGFKEVNIQKTELIVKKNTVCSMSKIICLMWQYKKDDIDKSFVKRPDLIILDGGKGQLSSVQEVVQTSDIELSLLAFAKKNNEFFIKNSSKPIIIDDEKTLYLLQRIRDEAHRFCNSYREELGLKKMVKSVLDDIRGIGSASKQKLLRAFGSVKGIEKASLDEVAKIVGEDLAKRVKERI